MEFPRKLIEVALPLDDINREASREKSIRYGHPSTLHLWWSRKPLAAARAVLFAQLVNDPGSYLPPEQAQKERERLFDIIRKLVKWENTTNETVLEEARKEIRKSWAETCKITGEDPEKLPPFWDPFAGGGTIPLEAQRLGLEAHASDLNPVSVMINKAMIEIPPKFAGYPPVGPVPEGEEYQKGLDESKKWPGTTGLAEDVRRYGIWMRNEAYKRIGHLYPQVDLPEGYGGGKGTAIAYIWARTVKCPNPACGCGMPLVNSFELSKKRNNRAWIEPVIDKRVFPAKIRYTVKRGQGHAPESPKVGQGAKFKCICCGQLTDDKYIKSEGKAGRMHSKLMAVVAEIPKGRIYLNPTDDVEDIARQAKPTFKFDQKLNYDPRNIWTPAYGLDTYSSLFTSRQLLALNTFTELVSVIKDKVKMDAENAGWDSSTVGLSHGGSGATAYGDAITIYLSFVIDKASNLWSNCTSWMTDRGAFRETFSRQSIPMLWGYAESNPFSNSGGNFLTFLLKITHVILMVPPFSKGVAKQSSASCNVKFERDYLISTDPPYFDNISYANLSDFFYVWMRKAIQPIYPDLFSTIAVPKEEELVATPYRHGGQKEAEIFFLDGMIMAIKNILQNSHNRYPVTLYYAFKQSETRDLETASTGWEIFLDAVIKTGFSITGTWPMRTEGSGRILARDTNALASSIVLVCRRQLKNAVIISRKQFLRELEEALPAALETMIGGKEGASPVAPVDLAQAAIGPGMAVFSKYKQVLEADGTPMSVRTALILINKTLDEYFTHAESYMDPDTQFCVDWFQQHGFKQGPFGEADVLARAKGTSVEGIVKAGVLEAAKGKVRLLKINEYPTDWDPEKDLRTPIWEACHHLCRALQQGEMEAGRLLAVMRDKTEPIRQLAYRLYTLCERKKWAEEARAYNELITSWHGITEASRQAPGIERQPSLF